MTLPKNCAACTMHRGAECLRHSPGPGYEKRERAFWPYTQDEDRCGEGSIDQHPIPCERCHHWWQPDGQPLSPIDAPSPHAFWGGAVPDDEKEWWAHSGYCTRNAPAPSSRRGLTVWRVTHGTLGSCGDGEEVLPDGDEEQESNGPPLSDP